MSAVEQSIGAEADLYKMSGDQIDAYYVKRRDEGASDAELRDIATNGMDAYIEEGQMCYSDVGFPGGTSGGGYSDPEIKKMDGRMRFLKKKIDNKEGDTTAWQKEYDELEDKKNERAEAIAEGRHEKVISKIGTIEALIKNPLQGLLKHDNGRKRKWVEVDALVQSRRKQEDVLLVQLKKDEEEEAKTAVTEAKRKHDLAMAEIKTAQQTKKDDVTIAKSNLQAAKEKAAAETAAAEKAAADAKKAEAEARKAESEAKKDQAKKEKKEKKEKKDKKAAKKDKKNKKSSAADSDDADQKERDVEKSDDDDQKEREVEKSD